MTDPKGVERLAAIKRDIIPHAEEMPGRETERVFLLNQIATRDATITRLTEDLRQTADAVRQEKEEVSRLTQERDEARRSAGTDDFRHGIETAAKALQSHGEHDLARMVRTIIRPGVYEGETLLSATQPTTDDEKRAREPGKQ